MSSWRDEYMQALHDRDEQETASYQRLDAKLIEGYTRILEQNAALEAEKAALQVPPSSTDPKRKASTSPVPNDSHPQLRSELAEALRSNGQLQSRVKIAETELVKLRVKTKEDAKTIEDLERERFQLSRKVKDRGEEVRGKGKLLEDLHDEIISLNIQLNMSEQTVQKLRDENKHLIDRWMASKRREADEMNDALRGESSER